MPTSLSNSVLETWTLAVIPVLKIRDEMDSYRVVTQVVTDG